MTPEQHQRQADLRHREAYRLCLDVLRRVEAFDQDTQAEREKVKQVRFTLVELLDAIEERSLGKK